MRTAEEGIAVPYLDVYIGDLSEFDFDDQRRWNIGHAPKALSRLFPPITGSALFWAIVKGKISSQQVDWGAWVAKATKAEIIRIVEDFYHNDSWALSKIMADIENLEEGKIYGLVASEL